VAGEVGGRVEQVALVGVVLRPENASGFHSIHEAPYVREVPYNTWANYGMRASGSGVWCWYIGVNWETRTACMGGFSTYSKRLEDGMEAAQNFDPENAGSIETSAQHLDGKLCAWNKARFEKMSYTKVEVPNVCVNQYIPDGSALGNINMET
jgi:hypothetical protein